MKDGSSLQYRQSNSTFQSTNRRSNSVLEQLSIASRQNLQYQNSNLPQKPQKYQSQYQYSSQHPSGKENFTSTHHFPTSKPSYESEPTSITTQNEALRLELETQKKKYQNQISKLKRNITLKDQLLDQCEKQIENLKNTYKTLISQFKGFSISQNSKEKGEDSSKTRQYSAQGMATRRGDKVGEGNLIPLSIVTKGMSRTGSASSLGGQKLTHGLIRGRV